MYFNSGSTEGISGEKVFIMSNAGMNTMIAGSSGALVVFVLNYFMTKQYSLVMMCNGNLAGLVSITG
jgi:Amt family ammonium transporter